MVDLSTHNPLISDMWDTDTFPSTPQEMASMLFYEEQRLPLEMTYSHVSREEVHLLYWTGVQRDWDKVQHMMDRDTMRMQRNN